MVRSLLLLSLLSGCSSLRVSNEEYYFEQTRQILEWNIPEKLFDKCYNLPSDKPVVYVSKRGRPKYLTVEKVIVYPKGYVESLVHEFQHYFNFNGDDGEKVSWRCLDEVSASYAKRIYNLEKEIRRLRSRNP